MQSTSTRFRSYAIDLWGFGDSTKIPYLYTLDKQVDLLDDFIDKLGIGKIALVGHGLGSLVCVLYGARKPDCVDRILTVSAPFEYEDISPRLLDTSPSDLADWLFNNSPPIEPIWQEAQKADSDAIKCSLDKFDQNQFVEIITKFRISHLTIYGQNDPLVTRVQQSLIPTLPSLSHQIVFEESGHFPMLDQPSQFNRLLADFLSLQTGESPIQLRVKDEWKRRVR
jgi:pimeloyl-ACP methyl ester carboxylesterase